MSDHHKLENDEFTLEKKPLPARPKSTALLMGILIIALSLPAGGLADPRGRHGNHKGGHPYRHGQVIGKLPHGYKTLHVKKSRYYFNDGIFFRPDSSGYMVVSAPIGAIVASLPVGHSRVTIGGSLLFNYADTYYRPVSGGYMVVDPPTEVIVQPPPQHIFGNVTVMAHRLNVRSGPGRGHPVVYQLPRGVGLTVYGMTNGWYYVQLPNGQYGWLMGTYTTMIGPPAEG